MQTTNIEHLIINRLTQEQYDAAKEAGALNENEIYLTPAQEMAWGKILGNIAAQTDLMALFNAINVLIPSQTTVDNQLADKEFVNSTAASQASHYIYKTNSVGQKVPFDSLSELEAYTGTVTPNDYANVITTDATGNTYYDRYTAVETDTGISWSLAFRINNSSLTAVQWAALNSGITAAIVALAQSAVQGTKVNGVSVVDENGIAQIQKASASNLGVVKTNGNRGVSADSDGLLSVNKATDSEIVAKTNNYKPVVPANLQLAVDTGVQGSTNYKSVTMYKVNSTTPETFKMYIEEVVS